MWANYMQTHVQGKVISGRCLALEGMGYHSIEIAVIIFPAVELGPSRTSKLR